MITELEYKNYFGVDTAPDNFERLQYISLNAIKTMIISELIPTSSDAKYEDFQNALMEQMNYYDVNSELIDNTGSNGYSLGSYSENAKDLDNSKSINKISPVAYDILLNCGLLSCGLGGVNIW